MSWCNSPNKNSSAVDNSSEQTWDKLQLIPQHWMANVSQVCTNLVKHHRRWSAILSDSAFTRCKNKWKPLFKNLNFWRDSTNDTVSVVSVLSDGRAKKTWPNDSFVGSAKKAELLFNFAFSHRHETAWFFDTLKLFKNQLQLGLQLRIDFHSSRGVKTLWAGCPLCDTKAMVLLPWWTTCSLEQCFCEEAALHIWSSTRNISRFCILGSELSELHFSVHSSSFAVISTAFRLP